MNSIKTSFLMAMCLVSFCNRELYAADRATGDISEEKRGAANQQPLVFDFVNMVVPYHVVPGFTQAAEKYHELRGRNLTIQLGTDGRTLQKVIEQLEDAEKVYKMDAQFDRPYAAYSTWVQSKKNGLLSLAKKINKAIGAKGVTGKTAEPIDSELLKWADLFVDTMSYPGNGPSLNEDLASTIFPFRKKNEFLSHPVAGSTVWAAARLAQSRVGNTPAVSFFENIAKAQIVASAIYHGYKAWGWYKYTVARDNILKRYVNRNANRVIVFD